MISESAAPSIVTLTTDFGLSDHYVGAMKGVILSRCPQAVLIDITHQIPAFSVLAGAYALAQAVPYFPPGTVHLVVVDPGVGTARRPVAVRAGQQFFIAPDNGVLGMVLKGTPFEAFEIANEKAQRQPVSETFHGRDVFAPAAAALASGDLRIEEAGPPIADLLWPENLDERQEDGAWRGVVLSIDRFGNVITNLETQRHRGIRDNAFSIGLGGVSIKKFASTFGLASPGLPFAYFGSSGFLEIGMNQASAAEFLRVKLGDPVKIRN